MTYLVDMSACLKNAEIRRAHRRGRLKEIYTEDLDWPFETRGTACVEAKPRFPGAYSSKFSVDPFPCYAHDIRRVAEMMDKVESLFPIGNLPNLYLVHFEADARTNGHASKHWIYGNGGFKDWEPYICLSGKRIPPHPGMTRYLVAHEYGHCVQWWIEQVRGIDNNKEVTDFDREYAELRGLDIDQCTGYGGLKWHRNIGELIANDFRICVTNTEPEFWPHEGFDHPDSLPRIHEFWERAVDQWTWDADRAAATAPKPKETAAADASEDK